MCCKRVGSGLILAIRGVVGGRCVEKETSELFLTSLFGQEDL